MRNRNRVRSRIQFLAWTVIAALGISGCGLFGGGGLAALPFGSVTAVQLFDEPDFTMVLSVEGAVSNSSLISKINWVFGDGSGFVEGPASRASITHQYNATGTYEITAFIFDSNGLIGQLSGVADVKPGSGQGPAPSPGDLPGGITGPQPAAGAENVSVTTKLTWNPGLNATSHDVYLGTDQAAVESAAKSTAGIFRATQSDTTFDPGGLDPETEYFWRIDEVNSAGTTKGTVRGFTTAKLPEAAKNPSPSNGSSSARVDTLLQWTAGSGASSHDVYFGKVMADVDAATTETDDIFQGNQTGTSFDPSDDAAALDGQLLPDTEYFWRIDEKGPGGEAKGSIWSFKTRAAPPKITNPIPADMALDIDVQTLLSWSASPAIESFDVYFGVDANDVDSATIDSPEFMGNQTSKSFNPDELIGDMVFFWRVDTLGPGGTTKGDLLRFTTAAPPPQAAGFIPAHNANNIDIDVDLKWNADLGGDTDEYDVYLSTDQNAVNTGDASALRTTQIAFGIGMELFDAEGLAPNTFHFWRIDAIGPGGLTQGPVLRFRTGPVPAKVTNPIPANNAKGVALDLGGAGLGWTGDAIATSFGVYFGTNQSDVTSATDNDAAFLGTVGAPSFDPGTLVGNTTYFWRIDAGAAGGMTKGDTWRFTTVPVKATNANPQDEEPSVDLDANLSWTAGAGATTHDVYFGTDENAVENATTSTPGIFKANQAGTNFEPGDLAGNTTYYWRIDERNVDGFSKGDVWEFTTRASQAAQPFSPTNGAVNVSQLPLLEWNAGDGAVSHDVYLGTSQSAVQNASTADDEFQGTQLLGDEDFMPAAELLPNTNYFWRIDERDAMNNITPGEVWQFKTQTGQATAPIPGHNDTGVDPNIDLNWTPGGGTTSHNVYFGTNETNVTNATTATAGIFKGNQAGTTFDPMLLASATEYFWRIDEVGPGGTTKGPTWKFTTGAGQASNPSPAHSASGVSLSPTLGWTPGAAAASQDLYFGTSENAVTNAVPGSGEHLGSFSAATNMMAVGPLDGSTFFFWRVDSINGDGMTGTKGSTWRFRTGPGKATTPNPSNFALNVSVNTLLSWAAGAGAATHDVYFIRQADNAALAVNDRIEATGAGAFILNQGFTMFSPGPLDPGTVYLWRIDSVAADGTTKTKGDVWRFTTLDTPDQVGSPSPVHNATGRPTSQQLQWGAAQGADSYDVYFSDVEADVISGAAFQGNQTTRTFNPGTLNAGSTIYYWRIDSVNEAGTTTGLIWQFTTVP